MSEWRISPSFPDYEVSEFGAVRRCRPGLRGGVVGKVLKPYRRADGYNMFILRRDNSSHHVRAHQLVCEAFNGPKPSDGAEVCHYDGSRDNDHWSNLRWDTRKANHADKVRHGTAPRGVRHPAAKLSEPDIADIRSRYAGGELQRVIAESYGIKQGHVSRVVAGDRWAHV